MYKTFIFNNAMNPLYLSGFHAVLNVSVYIWWKYSVYKTSIVGIISLSVNRYKLDTYVQNYETRKIYQTMQKQS